MAITVVKYADLTNWSMGNVVSISLSYNPKYELVMLSELLTFEDAKCLLEDDEYYQQVTLRSNGYGLENRKNGHKKGTESRTRDQHYLKTGQLVLSKIDARNGAFALVSEEYDGAIVTKDFPTYRIDDQQVRPQYLLLFLLSAPFLELVGHCSKGTTKRQRVDIGMLLNLQIPIPSLEEQDAILNKYYELLGDIQERSGQVKQKEQEKETFLSESLGLQENSGGDSIASTKLFLVKYDTLTSWNVNDAIRGDRSESDKYPTYTLSELHNVILLCRKGNKPKYEEKSPLRILNQKCIRWNYIDLQHAKGVERVWVDAISDDYATREGDVLVNSTGEGTIGRSAVVDKASTGLQYDSHVLLLRINPQRLNPFYLSFLINSKYGQHQIENLKSGKTTHQTELGVGNLSKMSIPLPTISEQVIIATKLQEINEEIAQLKDIDNIRAKARTYFERQVYKA